MARVPYPERETAPEDQKKALEQLEQKSRRVLNMYRLMSYNPAALETFMPFYVAAVNGILDPKHRELAYIRTSMINGCDYCEQAHRAVGRRIGLSEQQLSDLERFEASEVFSHAEKAVLRFAEELTRTAKSTDAVVDDLKKHLNSRQVVELTLVVAVANLTNRFNMGLLIDVDTRPQPKA